MDNHSYFVLSDNPRKTAVTTATLAILKYFFKIQKGREKWLKDKQQYTVHWTHPKTNEKKNSSPLTYSIISTTLRERGVFDPSFFNLPDMHCFWMDFSLDAKINFHIFDQTAPEGFMLRDRVHQQQYGPNYPINPKLDREGHLYTQMQTQLINRVIKLRTKLVDTSNHALEDDWVFDFRSLINDVVSLVDITLIQFYIKAEYDPLPTWKFDKDKVGKRHGRRIVDKFKWIFEITGNHFPMNATKEMKSFESLRKLRNHLMHFDPPSLVLLLEETTEWLNQVLDVGFFLIKMREAMGIDLSVQLINYILQKEIVFNPEQRFSKRLPINSLKAGYLSSCSTDINDSYDE